MSSLPGLPPYATRSSLVGAPLPCRPPGLAPPTAISLDLQACPHSIGCLQYRPGNPVPARYRDRNSPSLGTVVTAIARRSLRLRLIHTGETITVDNVYGPGAGGALATPPGSWVSSAPRTSAHCAVATVWPTPGGRLRPCRSGVLTSQTQPEMGRGAVRLPLPAGPVATEDVPARWRDNQANLASRAGGASTDRCRSARPGDHPGGRQMVAQGALPPGRCGSPAAGAPGAGVASSNCPLTEHQRPMPRRPFPGRAMPRLRPRRPSPRFRLASRALGRGGATGASRVLARRAGMAHT